MLENQTFTQSFCILEMLAKTKSWFMENIFYFSGNIFDQGLYSNRCKIGHLKSLDALGFATMVAGNFTVVILQTFNARISVWYLSLCSVCSWSLCFQPLSYFLQSVCISHLQLCSLSPVLIIQSRCLHFLIIPMWLFSFLILHSVLDCWFSCHILSCLHCSYLLVPPRAFSSVISFLLPQQPLFLVKIKFVLIESPRVSLHSWVQLPLFYVTVQRFMPCWMLAALTCIDKTESIQPGTLI